MWSLYLYSQFNNCDYEIVWYHIIIFMEYVLDDGDNMPIFFLLQLLSIFSFYFHLQNDFKFVVFLIFQTQLYRHIVR